MTTRRRFIQGSASVAAASLCLPSFAANWPNRPLKIIVPFAPGGSSDFIARQITQPLREALGQPVIVENRTGANAMIGAQVVAQATDDHTFLLSDMGSLAIAPLITKEIPFQMSELQGVTMLAYSPHLLVVHPAVPANNLKELVAFSQRIRINAATSGTGSPNHLGILEIALATGMKWQNIPYKGGAAALADTAAGNTHIVLNGMLATLPLVQGGKLRAIAVSKRSRVPLLPNLPTVAEQGIPKFETGTYQGVVISAKTPKEIVARLNAALIQTIRAPEMRARMTEAGAEVLTGTPAELNQFIVSERGHWGEVIKRAGKNVEGSA